mmetsp:Transcript_62798/g.173727  ORF Transcript_62798/g.173727 Transcript_62798/m.173727 type:complete len:297 (+) Transcript_62798:3-893(+)
MPSQLSAPGVPRHGDGARQARDVRRQVMRENNALRKGELAPETSLLTPESCSNLPIPPKRKGRLSFSDRTTADAALELAESFGKDNGQICVMNFANGEHVGGGYLTGALAQEEDLCRRMPNLFTSLKRASQSRSYPFGPASHAPHLYSAVLFTPDVELYRRHEDFGFEPLAQDSRIKVSVVSAAAPNVRKSEAFDEQRLRETLHVVFRGPLVLQHSLRVLVVGAWGCGAFGGDPQAMSELFRKVLVEDGFRDFYDEVHFAIPGRQGDPNAAAFRRMLQTVDAGLQQWPPRPDQAPQ